MKEFKSVKEAKMNAAIYTQYGPATVLQLKAVEKPIPQHHEILVRMKASAVNSGDVRLRKADPFAVRFIFGLIKPRISILGSVFSGEIESVGKDVTRFKVGDQIFGHTDLKFGAYAAYKCFAENESIAQKPSGITDVEAAVIPFGGTTALHFIKQAAIRPGQKVLIIGASGAVGTAAVQLAKSFGANVTGVCSTANIDLVKSIGADYVIDYTKEDFTKNGETYDVIFDTVKTISVFGSLKSLNKNGIMILSAAGISEMLSALWISRTSNIKVLTGVIKHSAADIEFLKKLIEEGKFKPVIDRIYTLEQIADAHAYVEKGHKKGNVAILIA
jgi:NADPH:quinone reductase-like Zn-dependent oxidoreductase